ncbi:MAG: 2-pyrone-4,6-dicarboxylate hydrolase [Sphingobium sp.]|nr:MAG: 2-pyrone-4,6-dicarboxylate hydrolase [Sphingobium sp.]
MTGSSPLPAVDCHAHCYDLTRQKIAADSAFHLQENELGDVDDFACVLDTHGMSHAVLVNPLGGYGTDNSYLLEALARGKGRFRGVALLPGHADDRMVRALADGGVSGIRFNLDFPQSPSLFGAAGARALAIAREAGWIVQVHYAGSSIIPALPVLRASGCPVVIDHCGRPDLRLGIGQPGFADLLAYGREGQAHIKLSAFFRMTGSGLSSESLHPFAAALVDAFTPGRCLWGSDWPFVRARRRIDYGPQRACLDGIVPDPADRRRILWDNPSRLFGFVAP